MADELCNPCLPTETLVQSTVDLEDIGEIVGGNCLMILTTDTSVVSAACIKKTYSTVDDALNDFGSVPSIGDAIIGAFGPTIRASQVVIGFYDPNDTATLTELKRCGGCIGFTTPELRDDAAQVAIAAWAQANKCYYGYDVCDPLHEVADPSTIGAQITAAGFEYAYGFYHTDCTVQKASTVLSQNIGHSFENGQDYTPLYESYPGIPPVNLDTQTLENLTGFSSVTGLDANAVNHLNVCACVDACGGDAMFWGLTASGDFFDNRHYTTDVDARIVAAQCNVLRGKVAVGSEILLANAVRNVLEQDKQAELILGYTVGLPVASTQATRSNRKAGCVPWTSQRNNPIHIACNNGLITQ